MKYSSKTIQKLLYFIYYEKTSVVFVVFHFVQLWIFTLWMPWTKIILVFSLYKIYLVLLEHFIAFYSLIYDEWIQYIDCQKRKKNHIQVWLCWPCSIVYSAMWQVPFRFGPLGFDNTDPEKILKYVIQLS